LLGKESASSTVTATGVPVMMARNFGARGDVPSAIVCPDEVNQIGTAFGCWSVHV
jgi:hypothetical protein